MKSIKVDKVVILKHFYLFLHFKWKLWY